MLKFLSRAEAPKSRETNEDLIFHYSPRLDVKPLRRTIYESGCVVIRGLIPKTDIDVFADLAERSFDACRRILQVLEVTEDEPLEKILDPRLQKFVSNIRIGQIEPQYFRPLNENRSIYDVLMGDAKRRQFVLSLLGGEWYPGAGQIRRISPLPEQQSRNWQAPIVMHCDGPILSRHAYSINFWVPMVACPGVAPGLQLVRGPFQPMQEAVKHDWEACTVDHDLELEMQRLYTSGKDGDPRFIPQLERGDVLVFHNWIIHGSYATPKMTKSRTSFELRFNAPTREHFEAFAS
jgi:hypothetical protein